MSVFRIFFHLLEQVNSLHTLESMDSFEKKVCAIIYQLFEVYGFMKSKEMVAMSGCGPGYMPTVIITPYKHILIFHIPLMLRNY